MALLRSAMLRGIRFYSRAISPALPPSCRFTPPCSAYAAEAIAVHGAGRGSWLTVRRLLKCAPWHPGGVDFVPGTVPATASPGTAPQIGPGTPDRATPSRRRGAHEESSVA